MIASRGCSIFGSGTVSQRMSSLPCQRSAFMARHSVSLLRRAGLGLLGVHLGQPVGGRDVGDRRLQFVLPAGHRPGRLALHYRVEALAGDIGGIVLFRSADLGVHHVSALKELCLGRARHQAGDGDTAILHLVAQGIGKGVEERLGGVVDRLIGPRH